MCVKEIIIAEKNFRFPSLFCPLNHRIQHCTRVCDKKSLHIKYKTLRRQLVYFCNQECAVLKFFVLKGIDYAESANFLILLFMLTMKLYVCKNLCENFRQIGLEGVD